MPNYSATGSEGSWTFFRNSLAEAQDAIRAHNVRNPRSGAYLTNVPSSPSVQMVTGAQSSFSLGGLARGIGGIATGLIPGTLDDKIFNAVTRRFDPPAPSPTSFSPGAGPCGAGSVRIGNTCVDPMAALPGGRPLTRPATGGSGQAEGISPWGLYTAPQLETRTVRRCSPGLVLGKDGNCYSGLSNKDRMHPKPTRPPITSGDMKAIRKANAAKNRVKRLAGTVGFTTKAKR